MMARELVYGPFDGRSEPFRPTHIAKQLARIALRDEPDAVWRCRYCRRTVQQTNLAWGERSDDPYPERDHVIPRCRGGTNDLANLALACQRCNGSKGDLLLSELPEGWPSVPARHANRAGRWRRNGTE